MDEYVAQATTLGPNGGQLPLLIGIALIMGLGKGGVPGFATIATAATVSTAPASIPGGLGYAVALQVPILTMIDVYAAWLHSDSGLDWTTVRLLLPVSFLGMAFGQALDRYMTDSAARVMVGVILLSILALRVYKQVLGALFPIWAERRWGTSAAASLDVAKREHKKLVHKLSDEEGGDDERDEFDGFDIESSHGPSAEKQQQRRQPGQQQRHGGGAAAPKGQSSFGWACAVGLIGGAATMLTNSMGPILNVYLLSVRRLPPASYIGTRAVFFCFLNLGKLPMRFVSGTLGWKMMPLAAGLGTVSVLGVLCAKPIMMSMKEGTFVKLELSVVAFAGVRLCWMGMRGA